MAMMPQMQSQRAVLWPAIVALGMPLMLVLVRASPLGPNFLYFLFGIPTLLVLWAIAATIAGLRCFLAARAQRWRRALSFAILPVVILLAGIEPLPFLRAFNSLGDRLHFALFRPYYVRQIAAMPRGSEPLLVVYDWGGMVWASGVIYDESDEVALPPPEQSSAWQQRASRTELSCEGYGVEPMGGHFYLGYFPC